MADVYDTLGGVLANQIRSPFKGIGKALSSSGKAQEETSDSQTVQKLSETNSLISKIKENFQVLPSISRDIVGVSNRVSSIVEIMGGKPAVPEDIDPLKDITPTPIEKPKVKSSKSTGFFGTIADFVKLLANLIKQGGFTGLFIYTFWDEIKKGLSETFSEFSLSGMLNSVFKYVYDFFSLDYLVEEFKQAKDNFIKEYEKIANTITEKYEEFREKYLLPIKNFIRKKFQSLVKKAADNNIIRKIVPNTILESTGIELNEEEKLKEAQRQKRDEIFSINEEIRKRKNQARIEAQTAIPSQKDPSLSIFEQSDIDNEIKQKREKFVSEDPEVIKLKKKLDEVRNKAPTADDYKPPASSDKKSGNMESSGADSGSPSPVSKVSGDDDIKAMIIGHEGYKEYPYKDSKGLWHIGVGHLIGNGRVLPEEFNRKFSAKEIMDLFEEDYAKHKKIAERGPGFNEANESGKAALIDLSFNMGAWYKEFKKTAAALREGDFKTAAKELKDSDWYSQVGNRGPTIVSLIESGGPESGGGDLSAASSAISSGRRLQTAAASETVQQEIIVRNNTNVIEKETVLTEDEDLNELQTVT